jgi:pimeloyl-ACP methyl ester carboxylesterase
MSAVTVEKDLVHYEVLGRGRPVVLLHSWIGSWRYWIPLMRLLQMKYRVYAIDLFGYGDSSKNRVKYPLANQILLIDDFLKQMGLSKVALIAHGLGAHIALEFAHLFPDRAARILITGAPLFDPGDLATRIPTGHQAMLTTLGDQSPSSQIDPSPAGSGQSLQPGSLPGYTRAHPADLATQFTMDTATEASESQSKNDQIKVDQDRLGQTVLDRSTTMIQDHNQMTASGSTISGKNQDNPLWDALTGGMENLLARCFKRSDAEYERFQADISKADDAVIFESAFGFDAGAMLDTVRLLKLPTVIVHGTDDPLIPLPGDDVWHYLTVGNEDTLLPIPLPGVGHFPMIEHEPFQRLIGLFLDTPDVSKIEVKDRWRRRSR